MIPTLRRGGLPNSENWFVVDMTPGTHPWEEAEAALLRVAVNPPDSLLAQLRDGPRGLLRAVQRILPADDETELVLIIDQFEELFTLVDDEAVRGQFLEGLVTAVLDPRSRLRVIVTMRADFTDRPLNYIDFGELMRQRTVFILPLTPDELTQAITRPVEQLGLQMEPRLVSTITAEVGQQPGMLPLLQYALTELFEHREGRMITLKAYHATGGVTGALARRADEIFGGLNPAAQMAARQMFLRLITLGEGVEDTRRRVNQTELFQLGSAGGNQALMPEVLETFGKHRLLTFDHDPVTRVPTAEVAHEALLREWPRLRQWLAESRDDVRQQRLLAEAARLWEGSGRDGSYLLIGSRLTNFEAWVQMTTVTLTADEQVFLEASITASEKRAREEEARRHRELDIAKQLAVTESARAEAEQRRAEEQVESAQALRQRAIYLGLASLVAIVLAIVATVFGQRSRVNAASAQAEAAIRATAEAVALAEREEALTQASLAQAQGLASAALLSLVDDPERSILLALRSLEKRVTQGGEEVLREALLASRVQLAIPKTDEFINNVTYSPDGKFIAAVEGNNSTRFITIWDAVSGETLLTLPTGDSVCGAPKSCPHAIAFSSDGAFMALEGEDNRVLILDFPETISTGSIQAVSQLTGHTDAILRMNFNSDGMRLATVSWDNTLRVWDLSAGEQLFSLDVPIWSNGANPIFSPDSSLLAVNPTGLEEGLKPQIFDAETGKLLLTSPERESRMSFSPDGKQLFQVDRLNLAVNVWDVDSSLATGILQPIYSKSIAGRNLDVNGMEISPDGNYLALAFREGVAVLWRLDEDSAEEALVLSGHTAVISSISFHPDGGRLVTAAEDGLKVWDISPGGLGELLSWQAHETGGNARGVSSLTASSDGLMLVTTSWDGSARIWDANTGRLLLQLAHDDSVYKASFSPDNRHLATASRDGVIRVWNIATGEEVAELMTSDGVLPSGFLGGAYSATYSPDGQLIAAGAVDGIMRVWDAVTYELLSEVMVHSAGLMVIGADFSPDGNYLAATTGTLGEEQPGILKVWDVDTDETVLEAVIGPWVWDVAFSPDGEHLAIVGWDGIFQTWDLKTGELDVTFEPPDITILTVDYSPNGEHLIISGADGVTRMWDASSGDLIKSFNAHDGFNTSATFSPDGDKLFTGGVDGLLHAFLLDLDDLIAFAETRTTRELTETECQQLVNLDACS